MTEKYESQVQANPTKSTLDAVEHEADLELNVRNAKIPASKSIIQLMTHVKVQ